MVLAAGDRFVIDDASSFAFSPDGKTLVGTFDHECGTIAWDIATARPNAVLPACAPNNDRPGHRAGYARLAVGPGHILIGGENETALRWVPWATKGKARLIKLHTKSVDGLSLNADETLAVSLELSDQAPKALLRVWKPTDSSVISTFEGELRQRLVGWNRAGDRVLTTENLLAAPKLGVLASFHAIDAIWASDGDTLILATVLDEKAHRYQLERRDGRTGSVQATVAVTLPHALKRISRSSDPQHVLVNGDQKISVVSLDKGAVETTIDFEWGVIDASGDGAVVAGLRYSVFTLFEGPELKSGRTFGGEPIAQYAGKYVGSASTNAPGIFVKCSVELELAQADGVLGGNLTWHETIEEKAQPPTSYAISGAHVYDSHLRGKAVSTTAEAAPYQIDGQFEKHGPVVTLNAGFGAFESLPCWPMKLKRTATPAAK